MNDVSVDIVAGPKPEGLPAPVCPVCGEPIGVAPTICPECETPHHWDCWEYNGGCAIYGCPMQARKAKERPRGEGGDEVEIPDKIPFPRLKAGMYLGFFFVTAPTAVFTILCELVAIMAFAAGSGVGAAAAVGGMVAAILWAALTAECYNLDILKRRISKSKLLVGKELFEWGICPLREVRSLDVVQIRDGTRYVNKLVANLFSGQRVELTPGFLPGDEDERAVRDLVDKIERGTRLPLGPGIRPALPAAAGATGRRPFGRVPGPG
jgi:hypothetical protein